MQVYCEPILEKENTTPSHKRAECRVVVCIRCALQQLYTNVLSAVRCASTEFSMCPTTTRAVFFCCNEYECLNTEYFCTVEYDWCCAVGQFFLSPILLWKSVFSAIISSLLYVSAVSYYHYMNFLGYSALPFLEHTELFMWPVPVCVLLLPFLLLVGLNPSRLLLGLFFQ